MKAYLIHYGELALKGNNRPKYEKALINNINYKLAKFTDVKVTKRFGKMLIKSDNPLIEDVLKTTPGIVYFCIANLAKLDIDDICAKALEIVGDDFHTFKIETKRSNKKFPLKSPEVSALVGAHILQNTDKKVLIRNYDKMFMVEIGEQEALVYSGKISGIGGLPMGSSGKIVGMISGGIDSPVAVQMGIKRGCEVVLMHAFNVRVAPDKVREKIYMIAEQIAKFQGSVKLYMVPYSDYLSEIVKNVPDDYRMIIFKRSVIRMANKIAGLEKASAILNGDCIGQVASQTLENIGLMHNASNLPILSPLLGMDKQEIMDIADKIGTYNISVLPYEDCCSLIAGKNPMTKGRQFYVDKYEKLINIEQIENQMLQDSVVKYFLV